MYNKRDKRKQYMANKIYDEIKKRISDYPDGTVFFTSDFWFECQKYNLCGTQNSFQSICL